MLDLFEEHFDLPAAASPVAELSRCRWQIEVFFKQIKQTLQLADFLGNSANAVRWQVWTALLVYVLLRYQGFRSRCGQQFRAALEQRALWAVVETGPGGAAQKLWDSRWRFSFAGPARSGVFAGLATARRGIAAVQQTPADRGMS